MEFSPLTAISPIDGRYHQKTALLKPTFSEFALIQYRTVVEVCWLMTIAADPTIEAPKTLETEQEASLQAIITNFSVDEAKKIKALEAQTHHDVKAVEYYLRDIFTEQKELKSLIPFIHIGLTSEDVNNLAYGLMLKEGCDNVLQFAFEEVLALLADFRDQHANTPMLSRTHGQAASPTTLGKECMVFHHRLGLQLDQLRGMPIYGKCNGAVGNYNALYAAYPKVNWPAVSEHFVSQLGLTWNPHTTQIESHDNLAELLACIMRINNILIDLCRDVWGYISLGYLRQKKMGNQVGSSTMPHKINPIDFENAEGNFGIANALAAHFVEKLPISRWQRDLSDSTVLRNLGVIFAHTLIGYQSITQGLSKVSADEEAMNQDLDQHWEVLGEAIQTILRRHGVTNAYEKLKTLTQGKQINKESLGDFIQTLPIPETAKKQLLDMTPHNYTGNAHKQCQQKA